MANLDSRIVIAGKTPNVDYKYGPYVGTPESVHNTLATYQYNEEGLTVGIKSTANSPIKEYWYVGGIQLENLVPKQSEVSEQVQSDWNKSDSSNPAYIKNKPTISDGGQGSAQIPLTGNVKVTARAATSGQTTGVIVTAENGGITMAFTLEKGTDGVNGTNGTNGIDGKSAYQQWLDEGNTGDETDFLNSLKAQIGKFIYSGYNATAAALSIGGTTTEALATGATNDSIVLMPNDGTTPTATMMFSVSVSDDPTPVTTYTYIGDVNVDASAFIGKDKIVQNINTGGADKVPSAAAVKGLNEKLYGYIDMDLESAALSLPSSAQSGTYQNTSDGSNAWFPSGYAKSSGVIDLRTYKDSGYKYLKVTMYQNESNVHGGGFLTFVKKLDTPQTATSFNDLVSGGYLSSVHNDNACINAQSSNNGEKITILEIPDDAVGVLFQYKNTNGSSSQSDTFRKPKEVKCAGIHVNGDVDNLNGIVVDNLSSDDGTKALSAKQGKRLAELTLQLVEPVNMLDPDTVKVGYYVRKDNGQEATGLSSVCRGYTGFFEIPTEGICCDNAIADAGTYGIAAVVYNETKERVGQVSAGEGEARFVAIDPTGHDTWKYVRFNVRTGNTGVYLGTSAPAYTPWFAPYLKMKDGTVADSSVTLDKLAFTKVVCGKNKLNPATMEAAHTAVRYTDGAIITLGSSQNLRATGLIPISKSGLIANHTPSSPGSVNMGYAVYDSDGETFVRGVVASGSTAAYFFDPVHDPVDGFVRFTMNSNWQNLQVEEGGTVTGYESYTEHKFISPEVLPISNSESEEELIEVLLPDSFFFVSGDTLQLFYKGMICSIDLSDKYVKPTFSGNNNEVTCQFKRYFEINKSYTSIGTYRLEINVYNDEKTSIAYGQTLIKTCTIPSSLPSWEHEKHILVIGDSMTDFPLDYKRSWLWECGRRLFGPTSNVPKIGEISFPKGSGLTNIKFIGSQTKSGDALHGENNASVTVRAFAKSGWGWKDYYDNNRESKSVRFYLQDGQSYDEGYVFTNNGVSYTIQELNVIDGTPTIKCNANTTLTNTNKPVKTGDVYILVGTDGHANINANNYEIDPANPLWNTEKEGGAGLDIQNYLDQVGKETSSDQHGYVDIVYFVLSWNNWVSYGYSFKIYIRTIVEQFNTDCLANQSYLPQIVLVLPCIPSMEVLMKGYGTTGTESDTYYVVKGMFEIGKLYKEIASEYGNVTFESWAAQFDSDYGYGWVNELWANSAIKDVNTRYSGAKEPYATNVIHPNNIGYMQMADACYRSIVCRLYGS